MKILAVIGVPAFHYRPGRPASDLVPNQLGITAQLSSPAELEKLLDATVAQGARGARRWLSGPARPYQVVVNATAKVVKALKELA